MNSRLLSTLPRSLLSRSDQVAVRPAVSVIVPVFGTEAYLPACLQSLLRQSLRDIEVIVVDDGSSGDVADVVLREGGGDPRLRVVRHPANRGTLRARLTGASRAIAPYLAFVDPDDVVEARFLEVLHDAATRYDADLVQCGITLVDTDATTQLVNRGGAWYCLNGKSVLAEMLAGRMSNSVANKLVRADCWHAATRDLATETRRMVFGEDLLLLFLLTCRSVTYAHVADPLYRYIRRADSATMAAGDAAAETRADDLHWIFGTVFARLQAIDEPEDLKAAFYQREFPDIAVPSDVGTGPCKASGQASPTVPDADTALRVCFLQPATDGETPPPQDDTVAALSRIARSAGHRVTLARPRATGIEVLDLDGESNGSCETRPFAGRLAGAPPMQAAYQTYAWLCQEQFDLVCASAQGGMLHYALTARAQGLALGSTRFGVVVDRLTFLSRHAAGQYANGIDDLISDHMERAALAGADAAAIVDADAESWITEHGWALPSCVLRALPGRAGDKTPRTDRSEAIWSAMFAAATADETRTACAGSNLVRIAEPPRVSVCITHCNRPTLLKQAVHSIRCQTYPHLQIVIVDDASTDPEAAVVLDELARSLDDGGLVVRHQQNRYLGAARNTAIQHAQGEFILFLDDDDYAKPTQVETLVRAALATGADIVTSFCDRFAGESPPGPGQVPAERWLMLGNAPSVGLFRNVFGPSSALFRRSALDLLGGFSEARDVGAEDWELFARASLEGLNLQTVPQALFWYRQTPGSMCATVSPAANHARSSAPYLALVPRVLKDVLNTAQSADNQLFGARARIEAQRREIDALQRDAQALRDEIAMQRADTAREVAALQAETDRVRDSAARQFAALRAEADRLHDHHLSLAADFAQVSAEAADLRTARLRLIPGDGETPQTAVDALWRSRSWRSTRFLRALARLRTGQLQEPVPQARTWAEAAHLVAAVQHSSSWELAAPLRLLRRALARLNRA